MSRRTLALGLRGELTPWRSAGRDLLSFPIYALKVDKSFIAALPESAPARAIVAAIAVMAHQMDKVVIAEGVETEAQLSAATELGCDYAQGFLLGRPSSETDLLAKLAE